MQSPVGANGLAEHVAVPAAAALDASGLTPRRGKLAKRALRVKAKALVQLC